MSKLPFGPGFSLGGVLYDQELNFRFEVWARDGVGKLSHKTVDLVYATWLRGSRKAAPKKNRIVRVQYVGDAQ